MVFDSFFLFHLKHERDGRYLGFEVVSLVPFEPYLIVPELMTHKQVNSEIIIFILSSYPYNFLLYLQFYETASLVEPLSRHGED